jgi:hypothetical protein
MPTKYPPALSFNGALRVIGDIFEVHARERFNMDLIADILETKTSSSYFPRRIAALQGFGLINRSGETIQLSELAIQIVKPVAGEDAEAKLTAFRKVDLLSDLLERYPNAKLPPSPDTLKQALLKSFSVDRETVGEWHEFVVDSFRGIAGVAGESQVISAGVHDDLKAGDTIGASIQKDFSLPLPSGRTFRYSIEVGYTVEDLDFLQKFMELLKSSLGQK